MQKRVILKYGWAVVLISVVTAIGLNNIILTSGIVSYSPGYQEATQTIYSPPFWWQLLYTGIIIPVLEELIFRGGVLRLLQRRMKFIPAMILSAILFGVYHWNLVQFVYATLCGLLLAYLCEVFGTLKAPVLSHMSMNLAACVMTEYGIFNWMFQSKLIVVAVTAVCIGVFAVLFLYIRKVSKNWMLQNC